MTRTGTDPETGDDVTLDPPIDSDDPSTWPDGRDWFQKVSDFSAGMADTLTGGLTQKVREGAGYDDVVDKNSTAYKAGEVAGTVLDVALTPVNPCGKVKWLKYAVKGLSAAQATGHAANAGEAFAQGDVAGGALSLVAARMSAAKLNKSCFAAGTPILVEGGSKPIEQIRPGELVFTRDDADASRPVVARQVTLTYQRVSPILNLHVGGRIIATTAEHPFYVDGEGWLAAAELRSGHKLISPDGRRIPVEGIVDSGRVETVYNLEVEECHTYFVGEVEWEFAVWVHNAAVYQAVNKVGEVKYVGIADRGLTKTLPARLRAAEGKEEGLIAKVIPDLENVPPHVAEAVEFTLIKKMGRQGLDVGGTLLNKSRGTGFKTFGGDRIAEMEKIAGEYLKKIGYPGF
jgi:hypothetical protein